MLEHTKYVLQSVSFNAQLFFKELKKALNYLLPYEVEQLKIWLAIYVSFRPELENSLSIIEG